MTIIFVQQEPVVSHNKQVKFRKKKPNTIILSKLVTQWEVLLWSNVLTFHILESHSGPISLSQGMSLMLANFHKDGSTYHKFCNSMSSSILIWLLLSGNFSLYKEKFVLQIISRGNTTPSEILIILIALPLLNRKK